MKKSLITFGILMFIIPPLFLHAQENWVSYAQAIQTEEYEGLRFRLQASVRAEIVEDSASARIWVRVDKEKGYGFFENMWDKPIRNKEWDSYTIEGTIDTGAYQIAFGALCQYNGKFFYDDLKLEIETKDNQWKNVYSADFEGNTFDLEQGIQRWESGFNESYRTEIYTGNAAEGKRCFLIVGKDVPNFGVNDKVGKFINVNGIQLYYETYGEGYPLVLLGTSGNSIEDASTFIPELSKKYKVIAFDNRGHGRSSGRNTEFSYPAMADDFTKALAQLKIDSAYLWGFSDGAIIGLVMAVKNPHLVKKMIAGVPNILPDTTAVHPIIHEYLQNYVKTSTNTYQLKLSQWMLSPSGVSFEDLASIQCPVLIVSGDRDWVRLEHTLKIFQSLPQSQLCILPGASHRAPWVKKEQFLKIADDFFMKPFSMPSTTQWFEE